MSKTEAKIVFPEEMSNEEVNVTKMNLFFIKSKHAFRQFKNHDYFQNKRNRSQSCRDGRSKEFVGSPTPYGINNAYNYICSEVSRNLQARSESDPKRKKTCLSREDIYNKTKMKGFGDGSKGKTYLLLPNLGDQSKQLQTSNNSLRLHFLQNRESLHAKTQQIIHFFYIDKDQPISKCGNYQLRFNIYTNIVNTFLKSRVNYMQMRDEQFALLKKFIIDIYNLQREYVEYKDMVNIRSMREIFAQLEGKQSAIYKKEMIRYFFVANSKAYEYQLSKIKDQLKRMIGFQFKKEVSQEEIYIYDCKTGTEITDLYELMKYGDKFLFSTDPQAVDVYQNLLREKQVQIQLVSRIRRWRSIVPEQSSKSESFKCMPQDRYHKIFNTAQKKRTKVLKNRKRQMLLLKSSQFIDRQKLCKQQGIFQ